MPEFPPPIPLRGGPYDTFTTEDLSAPVNTAYGVAFFPDHIEARGPEGSAVYLLSREDDEQVADFSHFG